jgi:flagellar biosynthesis protein FliP
MVSFPQASPPNPVVIGVILVLFIYITRLASNEIFSPSKEIHREVGLTSTPGKCQMLTW